MTFLSEPNEDANSIPPSAATTGPLVGFFESFRVAYETQMRTGAQFGVEYAMHELDWQQTQRLLDAGVSDPPQLMLSLRGEERGEGNPFYEFEASLGLTQGYYEEFRPETSGEYLDVAKRYNGQPGTEEFETRLREYDRRVMELRKERPDLELRTSEEMFGEVRERAKSAEQREQTDRRTWGGAFGGFFGGTLASLHPRTDPFNFLTLGVGGAGKTAAQRILFQTGAQGAIETVNQITGVQEGRELLGLEHGFGNAAQQVAATALGAGALQSLGEVAVAGARHWFRSSQADPAPAPEAVQPDRQPIALLAPPENLKEEAQLARLEQDGRTYIDLLADQAPLSGLRVGKSKDIETLRDMGAQLERWDSGDPVNLKPRTENAAFPARVTSFRTNVDEAASDAYEYAAARAFDPKTFRKYDELVEKRNTYRRWIEELSQNRSDDISSTLANMERAIHDLEARHKTTQGKSKKKRIREQIAEIKSDRNALLRTSETTESADVARVRRELVKVDEQMRDVAPLVSRAYSHVRGRWAAGREEMDAVWDAYRKGNAKPEPTPDVDAYAETAMQLADRAPIMRSVTREPGEPSADAATRAVAEADKVLDEAYKAYQARVSQLLSLDKNEKLKIEGNDYEFDIDRDTVFVPNEDGTGGTEMSIRQHLQDLDEANSELEAVSVCSIR